jgi:hypothetical protein
MGSKKLLLYLYLGAKLIKKKEAFTFFSLNMQNFSKKFDVAQLSTIYRTIPELCLNHPLQETLHGKGAAYVWLAAKTVLTTY